MSSILVGWWRKVAYVFVAVLLWGSAALAQKSPKPLPKDDQDKVDKAIEKGIKALKRAQTKDGDWPKHFPQEFYVGQCALPAYALLEAGVPPDDPVIQKAASYLRPRVRTNDLTYELSLALLFFDRLGDPKDEKLIQSLAARLIAGQHRTGGWSYRCPLGKEDKEVALLKALRNLDRRMAEGDSLRQAVRGLEIPRAWGNLTVFQEHASWDEVFFAVVGRKRSQGGSISEQLPPFSYVTLTDNSNTQFAMLALWRAKEHDVPTKRTFALMVERFERYQFADGWWDYEGPAYKARITSNTNPRKSRSMICVGLLALALGKGEKLPTPGATLPEQADLRVLRGLAALYPEIGVPTRQMIRPVPPDGLYFLWSVERLGMLYDLPTIGDKDWYRWMAEMLVTNQYPSGRWWDNEPPSSDAISKDPMRGYGAVLNTAFALLILKHSHPMRELTAKLPYKAEKLNRLLNGLITGKPLPLDRPTTAPSRSEKSKR